MLMVGQLFGFRSSIVYWAEHEVIHAQAYASPPVHPLRLPPTLFLHLFLALVQNRALSLSPSLPLPKALR